MIGWEGLVGCVREGVVWYVVGMCRMCVGVREEGMWRYNGVCEYESRVCVEVVSVLFSKQKKISGVKNI